MSREFNFKWFNYQMYTEFVNVSFIIITHIGGTDFESGNVVTSETVL